MIGVIRVYDSGSRLAKTVRSRPAATLAFRRDMMDRPAFERRTMTLAHRPTRRRTLRLLLGGVLGALLVPHAGLPARAAQLDPGGLRTCNASGLTDGGGVCADVRRDLSNCGSCFTACGNGIPCLGGVCSVSAVVENGGQFVTCGEMGLVDCDGECVDLGSDPWNCGQCDYFCEPDQVCERGASNGPICAAGWVHCQSERSGPSIDLSTDPNNCGACYNSCPLGGYCQRASARPGEGRAAGG
jgi:hypothetical protein